MRRLPRGAEERPQRPPWLRRAATVLCLLLGLLVVALMLSSELRQLGRQHVLAAHWSWERLVTDRQLDGAAYEDPHGRFIVAAKPGADAFIPLVATAAANSFEPLAARYEVRPAAPVLIVIHPDRESLARAFGWSRSETAMGIYRGGVVRVLAPDQWIQVADPAARDAIFLREGPVTHELAHLFLDLRTGGNYPRWFSEGLAQYEEYRLKGWIWRRGLWALEQEGAIPMERLDRALQTVFDAPRAYYQSLSLVRYLVWAHGEEAPYEVVAALAAGESLPGALDLATGLGLEELAEAWWSWFHAGEPTGEGMRLYGP